MALLPDQQRGCGIHQPQTSPVLTNATRDQCLLGELVGFYG